MARKTSKNRDHGHPTRGGTRHALEFWSGTITFGLVSVPIRMLPASRNTRVALREMDTDGTPLRRRFFCPEDECLVPPEQIVRGFEYESGHSVTITDKELEALEPRKSREIDLQLFVDRNEISPLYYERSYYLAPSADWTKAYRLLARVLERTERAGIATFVMHDREYLIAIIGEGGILRGQTLHFQDEVRSPSDLSLPEKVKVDSRLSAKCARVIKAMAKEQLDSRGLQDEYAQRLKTLVDHKRKHGIDVVEVHEESEDSERETGDETDLLETIRQSLGARRGGRHSGNGEASHNGRYAPAQATARHALKSRPKAKKSKARGAVRTSSSNMAKKDGRHRRTRSKGQE